jgi:hypothetical protein
MSPLIRRASLAVCVLVALQQPASQRPSLPAEQERAAVNTFAQEVFGKLAEDKGREAARLKAAREQEEEAKEEAREVAEARRDAEKELQKANRDYALAQLVVDKGNTQKILGEKYERIVSRKAAADAEVLRLRQSDEAARAQLSRIQDERAQAERAYEEREALRAQQRARFELLYNAWQESRSDEAFKELTGYVTDIAGKLAGGTLTSDVDFTTVDANKKEQPGALIYYESSLDRKNGVKPIKSISKSTKWTETGMRKGWYYFWSVRGGKETSDKNRYLPVKGPKDQIEITEDR